MASKKAISPKQVVYLWGAGGTQAEAQNLGIRTSLLMRDIGSFEGVTTRILRRTRRKLGSPNVDIEKLISLLAGSGIERHAQLAEQLRQNYFRELRMSLRKSGVLKDPQLAIRLLRMHQDPKFQKETEMLTGFITTNHDGLLQVASQEVFKGINLGFPFSSDDFDARTTEDIPPILQLHGSFTWHFGLPIRVEKLRRDSGYHDTIWVPPTILKEAKTYPFNKLLGLSYELLARRCDVLRIVGASMTQNDWNILSLIFNAQWHREATNGTVFKIELVMPHKGGEQIKSDCAYLRDVLPIGYLTDGDFTTYKEDPVLHTSEMENPFAYWLNEKIEYHLSRRELSHSI